jgi:hypothetical protein
MKRVLVSVFIYGLHFQKTGLSVQASISTNNETLEIATVVQQVMTELSEAVSEEDKVMVITKIVLNKTKWLLNVISFNANEIWRQRYELRKQLKI